MCVCVVGALTSKILFLFQWIFGQILFMFEKCLILGKFLVYVEKLLIYEISKPLEYLENGTFYHQNKLLIQKKHLKLSAGLELVLSQTEKSCMASNYRQFSMNIKIIN